MLLHNVIEKGGMWITCGPNVDKSVSYLTQGSYQQVIHRVIHKMWISITNPYKRQYHIFINVRIFSLTKRFEVVRVKPKRRESNGVEKG